MAENIFRDVTLDERAWVEKRSRELAEHTRATEMYEAREEAMEQGLEQGLKQGRNEGIAQGEASKALEMAKAMKEDNKPVDEISKYTGLSIEEIEKL